MLFWNYLAFSMIQQILAIWSLVPLPFSKYSLYIWKFSVHGLLKPGLENFERYFASVWKECSCAVLWTFFGTAKEWILIAFQIGVPTIWACARTFLPAIFRVKQIKLPMFLLFPRGWGCSSEQSSIFLSRDQMTDVQESHITTSYEHNQQ